MANTQDTKQRTLFDRDTNTAQSIFYVAVPTSALPELAHFLESVTKQLKNHIGGGDADTVQNDTPENADTTADGLKRSKCERNPFKRERDGISVSATVRTHLQIFNSKLENPLKDSVDINERYEHFLKNKKFYKTASRLANKINGRDGGLLLLPNSWLGGCIASVCHIGTDKEFDNAETFFRNALNGGSDFLAVNDLHKELINDWSLKNRENKRPNCCAPELDTLKKIFKAWAIFKDGKKATPLKPDDLDGVTLP